jgi:hypothetical protein
MVNCLFLPSRAVKERSINILATSINVNTIIEAEVGMVSVAASIATVYYARKQVSQDIESGNGSHSIKLSQLPIPQTVTTLPSTTMNTMPLQISTVSVMAESSTSSANFAGNKESINLYYIKNFISDCDPWSLEDLMPTSDTVKPKASIT